MCRFLAYKGAPVLMDELLYQPRNSLIRQSFKAREREEPLNGDGFGVGWYMPEIDTIPAVFTSVQPAWNNMNLQSLAPKIRSGLVFAHIRAASSGGVSQLNCHPFRYGNYLFMHNGSIGGFRVIKRALRRRLPDDIYDWISGETDTEHLCALFLEQLQAGRNSNSADDIKHALISSFSILKELQLEHGITRPSYLNFVVTDGNCLIATRYVSDSNLKPHTLYYSEGSRYECVDGICKMQDGDISEHAVLIVSEKLTDVKKDWQKVPPNHLVIVDEDLAVTVLPIKD